MNLVKLSGLALLTSVGLGQSLTQQPSRVVIDGAEVPASALRFVTGAPLVSCQWLDKNVSSLNCQSNPGTADYGAAAYIDENAEPLEGRDASGCCAEWRRSLSFRDGQLEYGRFETERGASPLPMLEVGRGATGSIGVGVPKGTATPSAATQFTLVDAFVPLRDVAFHMRMPWGVSGNTLSIGSSAGFKRTLEVIETGEVWEARIASRYFKFKPSLLKLPPQQADSSDPTLLIWPQGQVKKVFYIEGKTLDVLEFKNRRWETAYRARLKLAPI